MRYRWHGTWASLRSKGTNPRWWLAAFGTLAAQLVGERVLDGLNNAIDRWAIPVIPALAGSVVDALLWVIVWSPPATILVLFIMALIAHSYLEGVRAAPLPIVLRGVAPLSNADAGAYAAIEAAQQGERIPPSDLEATTRSVAIHGATATTLATTVPLGAPRADERLTGGTDPVPFEGMEYERGIPPPLVERSRERSMALYEFKSEAHGIARTLDDPLYKPEHTAEAVNEWFTRVGEWISTELGALDHAEWTTAFPELPYPPAKIPQLSRGEIPEMIKRCTSKLDEFIGRLR